MLELFIVRHGESVRNHACDLARHGDDSLLRIQLRTEQEEAGWSLTPDGVRQAQTAGNWLRSHAAAIDCGYTSPFLRTRQTAEALDLGIKWKVDPRLREREWGNYDPAAYTPEQYLEDITHCGEFSWKSRFPEAESISDLISPARSFLTDLLTRCPDGRVAVVTHGGTMGALQLVMEGLPPDQAAHLRERHLTNCCILHYRLSGREGRVQFVHPCMPEVSDVDWHAFTVPDELLNVTEAR